MILAMARWCRCDWQMVCLTCRGLADFFADFAQSRGQRPFQGIRGMRGRAFHRGGGDAMRVLAFAAPATDPGDTYDRNDKFRAR